MSATGLLVRRVGRGSGPTPGNDHRSSLRRTAARSWAAQDEHPPHAASLGEYLYEPDAAVLAAGLTATLAEQHDLAAITPGIGYLTGDQVVADPALAGFAIRDVLPFDRRRMRAAPARTRHRPTGNQEAGRRH